LSPQAQLVRFFAKFLANRAVELGVLQDRDEPFVYLWDERLTSQAARVAIKTKSYSHSCECTSLDCGPEHLIAVVKLTHVGCFMAADDVDSQAACLMLEDFYQQRGKEAEVILPDEDVEVIALPAPTEPEEEAPPGLSMTYKVCLRAGASCVRLLA
jgi:RNase H-fold protein (predicted Holliday junction resolvase)